MKIIKWKTLYVTLAIINWIMFVLYWLLVIIPSPYYWINRDVGILVLSYIPIYAGLTAVILGIMLAIFAVLGKVPLAWGLKYSLASALAGIAFWLFNFLGDMSV